MANFEYQHFARQDITVNGNSYVKCVFDDCRMTFEDGGSPCYMSDIHFELCTFIGNEWPEGFRHATGYFRSEP